MNSYNKKKLSKTHVITDAYFSTEITALLA